MPQQQSQEKYFRLLQETRILHEHTSGVEETY